VLAVFRPKRDVVHVRKDRVSAAGDATFPAVPAQDRAAECGRDGLRCADASRVSVAASVSVCVGVSVPVVVNTRANAYVVINAHVGVTVSANIDPSAHVVMNTRANVYVVINAHVGASVSANTDSSVCVVKNARANVHVVMNVHVGASASANTDSSISVVKNARGNVHVVMDTHVGASACVRHVVFAVHVPNVLPVALRHLDDFRTHVDELTSSLLLPPAAALANRERNLVARAPRVLRALESLTAEKQDGCVVIERLARVATDFRHCFAKGRKHLA
jgi:hypothetical protein